MWKNVTGISIKTLLRSNYGLCYLSFLRKSHALIIVIDNFSANKEINSKKRTFDAELSKLATQIKRLTIQNKSLNEALVQKKTELEEMNKVYDDMLQVKTNIPQM